jgi:hypothetical protein
MKQKLQPPEIKFGVAHAGYVITLLVAVFSYAMFESRRNSEQEGQLSERAQSRTELIHARDRETDDLKARIGKLEARLSNCGQHE